MGRNCENPGSILYHAQVYRFSHVKGHQDDALYEWCKIRNPLPRISHYNIAMDKVAEQCRTDGSQPTMTTVLQSSKIALVLNSAVVTSNVEAAIKHAMKYEPVQTYLCQRNQWTLETFQLVDWTSFGRYFKSILMAKRIKAAKYMSDWQNTGSQKEKYARSKTIKDPLEEEEYQAISRCPMQCRNCKNPQHCLHCTNHPKPDEIKRCINSIAKWMMKVGTSLPLKIIILKAMREWLQEGKVESDWTFTPDDEHASLPQAFHEQKHIGWQTWTAIQQSEYSKQNQRRINSTEELTTQTLLWKPVGCQPYQAGCLHEPQYVANSQ